MFAGLFVVIVWVFWCSPRFLQVWCVMTNHSRATGWKDPFKLISSWSRSPRKTKMGRCGFQLFSLFLTWIHCLFVVIFTMQVQNVLSMLKVVLISKKLSRTNVDSIFVQCNSSLVCLSPAIYTATQYEVVQPYGMRRWCTIQDVPTEVRVTPVKMIYFTQIFR